MAQARPLSSADFYDYCPHCGKQLPLDHDKRQIFCSYECSRVTYWEMVSRAKAEARKGKTCRHCGSKFDAKNLSKQVFCSGDCRNAYFNGLRSQRDAAARAGRTCIICGEPFTASRSDQLKCRRCRFRRPKRPLIRGRICKICGQPFDAVRASHVRCRCCRSRPLHWQRQKRRFPAASRSSFGETSPPSSD
jgi:DNA-directed RNA polymerase subunit RPC12/RpoP